jgi:hypothetical protein
VGIMVDKQDMKLERQRIAKRLRQGRINAGFPTANHASLKFGWGMKTYVQHEEAIKSFDYDTALLYSKAFNIDIDLLNSNKVKK